MRVVYLINQYPKISHTFVRTEILELERTGHVVGRVALRGWDGALVDPVDELERERTFYVLQHRLTVLVAVLAIAVSRPIAFLRGLRAALTLGIGGDRPLPLYGAYLAEACVILRWNARFRGDHLHAHFGTNSAAVAMIVRALGGPPYSFTVHGPEEFDRPVRLKLREKVRDAAFVVAISSFGRSQLFRWVDFADWPKVQVVRCGLAAAQLEAEPSPAPAAPRLVCVGRLCEQKGQLLLVRACALARRRGAAFELVLAGDGEMRGEIEAAIADAGLAATIRITGWLSSDEVDRELRAARTMVLASFAEGLPVVIMEAMAAGRPVLSTYIAGIPELVIPGVHGLLVPAGDVDALADAIVELIGYDDARLQAMGAACRARVADRHAIVTEAGKLAALFAAPPLT